MLRTSSYENKIYVKRRSEGWVIQRHLIDAFPPPRGLFIDNVTFVVGWRWREVSLTRSTSSSRKMFITCVETKHELYLMHVLCWTLIVCSAHSLVLTCCSSFSSCSFFLSSNTTTSYCYCFVWFWEPWLGSSNKHKAPEIMLKIY